MYSFFLVCAGVGAAVLVLQIVLAVAGAAHEAPGDLHLGEGLDLLSVRSISAGLAGFGLAGMGALAVGLPAILTPLPAAVLGSGVAVATAWLTRLMLRLDDSGSLRLEGAVGHAGTVQLSIPDGATAAGRIQFELQGRTLEMKAVSSAGPIAIGTPVTIVGLVDGDTVEVVPTPTLKEIIG